MENMMPKFKKGDKVRVCLDTITPYRGRTGIVDGELEKDSYGFSYMVKFESKGLTSIIRFTENDLEDVS